MMTFAVQRMNGSMRATLLAHFFALPMKDRCLRFGTLLAPAVIATYVEGIDFDRDAVLGVHDDRLVLVGAGHLAIPADFAELALSVLPAHRGRGIGVALFKRAAAHARGLRVPRLVMHCRSGNAPIMRIARKFGMHIVARGVDADACLDLQPASPGSMVGDDDESSAESRPACSRQRV
jgi:GNAT superfamily N-acetyltransferase